MEARCEENSRTGTTTSLSPAAAACGAQPRYPPPPPSEERSVSVPAGSHTLTQLRS